MNTITARYTDDLTDPHHATKRPELAGSGLPGSVFERAAWRRKCDLFRTHSRVPDLPQRYLQKFVDGLFETDLSGVKKKTDYSSVPVL
jgi:hypothetical protein